MNPAFVSAGAVAAAGGLAWTIVAPTSTFWGPLHWRGTAASASFALTFDDGPTRDSTAATLDLLGELGAAGTFFVIGVNARRCPDLLVRMRDEGHLVANHSMHHAHLGILRSGRYWDRELRETDRIIEETIGLRPAFFRPPMGVKSSRVMGAARRSGHQVITWTRRAVDGIRTTPQRILDRLLPSTGPGDILLLHDGNEPRSRRDPWATVAALRPLIEQLRHRGLSPVSLEQLLQTPAYAGGLTAAGRSPNERT